MQDAFQRGPDRMLVGSPILQHVRVARAGPARLSSLNQSTFTHSLSHGPERIERQAVHPRDILWRRKGGLPLCV